MSVLHTFNIHIGMSVGETSKGEILIQINKSLILVDITRFPSVGTVVFCTSLPDVEKWLFLYSSANNGILKLGILQI